MAGWGWGIHEMQNAWWRFNLFLLFYVPAVLIASAVAVFKHKTLTPCKSHNYISIDFKFSEGDHASKFHVSNTVKFGSDPISGIMTYAGPVTF